ncbi:MAG TPA: hypothetical protein VEP90_20740 [Methylomirabilota bacterium]|nr:hypothetical protein [Methylomirabilota bacterium]
MMGNVIVAGDAKADAYALLSLAQDPESTKLRLDQITSAGKEYHDLISKNADILVQTQKEHLALEDAKRKLEEDKASFEQMIRYANEDLESNKYKVEADRKDAYNVTQANIAKSVELVAKESKLEKRDTDLSYREQQVEGREDAVSQREAVVESLKQDYENKLKQLKDLLK